jgi:hypothetical protein
MDTWWTQIRCKAFALGVPLHRPLSWCESRGLVGPPRGSLKVLTREEFKKTVTDGRLEKGMPSQHQQTVTEHLDQLYAYLKGRADGAIKSQVER